MIIKLIKTVACLGCSGQGGELVEVEDKLAKALIGGGMAEIVQVKANKSEKETALSSSSKKIETATKK